jgi:hypothetical protein
MVQAKCPVKIDAGHLMKSLQHHIVKYIVPYILLGTLVNVIAAAWYTVKYVIYLGWLDGGVGLASFEELFIFPVVFVDLMGLLFLAVFVLNRGLGCLALVYIALALHSMAVILFWTWAEPFDMQHLWWRVLVGIFPPGCVLFIACPVALWWRRINHERFIEEEA